MYVKIKPLETPKKKKWSRILGLALQISTQNFWWGSEFAFAFEQEPGEVLICDKV